MKFLVRLINYIRFKDPELHDQEWRDFSPHLDPDPSSTFVEDFTNAVAEIKDEIESNKTASIDKAIDNIHAVLMTDPDSESKDDSIPIFPHCDAKVLHAPGECQFCDLHPEWQLLRKVWGINFTGKYDTDKLPCPAETKRDLQAINNWPGNVPDKLLHYPPRLAKFDPEVYPEDAAALDAMQHFIEVDRKKVAEEDAKQLEPGYAWIQPKPKRNAKKKTNRKRKS